MGRWSRQLLLSTTFVFGGDDCGSGDIGWDKGEKSVDAERYRRLKKVRRNEMSSTAARRLMVCILSILSARDNHIENIEKKHDFYLI